MGEAPSGLKDVFELCRGFERAFSNIVNDSPSASKIKAAFFSEKGLAGAIQRLPLEAVFELDSVKRLCKTADGYQPHMVSPERGLRLMASKALDQVDPAVQRCVADVYGMLVGAGREAAAAAGEHTEAAMAGKVPLNAPEFRNVIMPAVIRALDEWRDEALRMARMMVDMERSYITAGFFRYTMYRRYERSVQQATLAAALAKRGPGGVPGGGPGGFAPGGQQQQLPPGAGGPGAAGAPGAAAAGPGAGGGGMSSDPGDYIAAFFDKKVNEDSARGGLPVDGWRWQRRFFIFSDSQRALYYFKSPDDVPKPNGLRGQVYLGDCVVEDLDERGEARRAVGSAAVEMQRGDRASLLLRLRSRDPRRPCVKDHTSVVLRAENVGLKYEWIARLAAAAAGAGAGGAAAGQQQQGVGGGAGAPNGAAARASADDADSDAGAADLVGPLTGGAAAGDPTASGGGAGGGGGGVAGNRRDSFDGLTETRLGQGARFFRADDLRDERGFLLPAPCIVLGPSPGQLPGGGGSVASRAGATAGGVMDRLRAIKIGKGGGSAPGAPLTVQESWEQRYEQIMDQFAQDMSVYMRMVCDTVVTTVPKSVVHCLVRKAEKNLLNHLFGFVHKMSEPELGAMLREDEDVVEKRKAVRALYAQVRAAIDDVQYLQQKIRRREGGAEEQAAADGAGGAGGAGGRVTLPAETLALAGLGELLDGAQRRAMAHLLAPAHLPALRAPVPMSHLDRPKKLPTAPAGLLEPSGGGGGGGGGGASSGGGGGGGGASSGGGGGGVVGGVASAAGAAAGAAAAVARRVLAGATGGKVPPAPPPGTGGATNGGPVPSARRAPPPPPPK